MFGVSLSLRPLGCRGMGMQGPLRRQLRQAPLRARPQVLDFPGGEDGQLRFGQARKLQTRCLKDAQTCGS